MCIVGDISISVFAERSYICSIAVDPIKFSFSKFSMLITCIFIEILIS